MCLDLGIGIRRLEMSHIVGLWRFKKRMKKCSWLSKTIQRESYGVEREVHHIKPKEFSCMVGFGLGKQKCRKGVLWWRFETLGKTPTRPYNEVGFGIENQKVHGKIDHVGVGLW